MSMIRTIPWKPRAKQRPRFANGIAYTPKETKEAEAKILARFQEIVGDDYEPYDGPISVALSLRGDAFVLSIWECDKHNEKYLSGDIDNYAKTILDALNGAAWIDDKQITKLTIVKE